MRTRAINRLVIMCVVVALFIFPSMCSIVSATIEPKYVPVLNIRVQYRDHAYNCYNYSTNAKVTLTLVSSGQIVATGYTDSNGLASFYPSDGTYYATAWTTDDVFLKVADYTNNFDNGAFHFVSSNFYYDSSTRSTQTLTCDNSISDVWSVYTALVQARAKMIAMVNYNPLPVTAYYPRSTLFHNNFQWDRDLTHDWIDLGTVYSNLKWRKNTYHEFGHHVMWGGRGKNMPGIDLNSPSNHDLYTEARIGSGMNWGFSWTEGFAEFMSCVFDGSPTGSIYYDVEYGGNPDTHIVYANMTNDGGNSGDFDGWDVEGAVCAALWDIYDGTNINDYPGYGLYSGHGDYMSCGFSGIWDIVSVHKANTMKQLYDYWIAQDPANTIYLQWILYNHKMDVNNLGFDT